MNTDKNVAIAILMGAVIENWYPYNKDTKRTGKYLKFPEAMYIYDDIDGKKKQYRWYPDNQRYHGDALLKFDTDSNWQFEAISWIEKQGYDTIIGKNDIQYWFGILAKNNFNGIVIPSKTSKKQAIFETLFQFSQFIKQK